MNRPVVLVVLAAAVLAACDRVVDLTSSHDAMIGGDTLGTDTGLAVPDGEIALDTGFVPDAGIADAATILDAGVGSVPDAAVDLDAAAVSEAAGGREH
jgi:hypothetical protein